MREARGYCSSAFAAAAVMLVSLLAFPSASRAQTVTGQATAVQATVFSLLGTATSALGGTGLLGGTSVGQVGTTNTTLADTGTIGATNVEQDVGQVTGSVASLLGADVLSSSTYSYSNEVDSESSLGDLNLTVAGVSITASSVEAEASQVLGAAGKGTAFVDELAVNGVPIWVSGDPNQTVAIPGGQLIINEQTVSSSGAAVVNALHITLTGVADVVVASARAGISQ